MSAGATPPAARPPLPEAELRKLAHVLGVDHDALQMIAGLPGEDLRTLRAQIGEALFRADKPHFARVANLSKTVPTALVAKLTEAVMPPLLAARTAELLEPKKAAELVGRLSESYLADVSAAMDASRAPEVVAAIPPDRVATVGVELARREEWVVIGGFVSHVSQQALAASIARFDGEQLLRLGFVLDDLSRLDRIGELLTVAQIDQLLAAAAEFALWDELDDFLANLTPPRRERLAERFVAAPEPVQAAFSAAVAAGSLPTSSLASLTG